jgi:hypothetical protein
MIRLSRGAIEEGLAMSKKRGGVRGMITGTLKTDESLVQRLHAAAARELTKEELLAQRVSFAYGNLPQDSSVSRNEVAAMIAKIEGSPA